MKARYIVAAAICAALLGTGSATAGSLITGAKIKDGTITGRDIKDGTLLAADFKRGQLPAGPAGRDGAPGAPGAPGQQGPAGPTPSGTPKVTALPDIAMKPDDPARAVATVGPFSYRMSCAASWDLFTEVKVDGGVTVRTTSGLFFWAFSGGAGKTVAGAPFDDWSTDSSGPGYDAWTTSGEVARVVGDFAVTTGGCTLSNAKAYLWG
jgi:hypothetical protein